MSLKLPDVTALGDRPTPQPALGVSQAQVAGFTGLAAHATRAAASSLGQMGDEFEKQNKIEQDRLDRERADEAFNKIREQQIDLTQGEENGFMRQKGSAVVDRKTPLNKEYLDRFDTISKGIESGLTTDRQKVLYRERAAVSRAQFDEHLLRHMASENDTYSKEVFEGTLGTETRAATANWNSPNDVGISIMRITDAVEARSQKLNWPKQYTEAVLQEKLGKLHSAVVTQALASKDYEYAQAWYEEHKADIDVVTAKQVQHQVEEGTQKALSAGYNADYLANQNSRPSLEQLHGRILEDKTLDDTRRNVLAGRVQNRMQVLEHRDDLERERGLRRIQAGVNELNSNTLAGFEPTDDQFTPVLAAAKGTEMEPAVKQAIGLANATRAFRNSTPATQERLLGEAEAGVRKEPGKFDRRVVAAWRQIYDAQREQARTDPVSFAVRQGFVEPLAPLDLANPYSQGEAMQERFAVARGVAAKYQAPLKPLTSAETALLSATLKAAGPTQKREYFGQLAQAAGQDYEGYSAIMSQIAPDDPATAVAGTYQFRGRSKAADLILRGQAVLNPAKKEDGKPVDGGKLWPMPPEKDLKTGWTSYEKDAFAGHPGARNAMYQSAMAIYAAKSVDEGDSTGVINTGRWEESIRLATGGIEKHKGRAITLPYGYEYGQFTDALRSRIDLVVEQGRLKAGQSRATLEDLPLEAVGDGRYVFRAGDGYMVDKKGEPILVDFNEGLPFKTSGYGLQDLDRPATPAELDKARQPATGRTDKLAESRRRAQQPNPNAGSQDFLGLTRTKAPAK